MLLRSLSIAALSLALAACGSEADVAESPTGVQPTESAAAQTPVAGPERRILAFGDSLFAGYGLEQGQGYPERLEAALRKAGVNAHIANAGICLYAHNLGRVRINREKLSLKSAGGQIAEQNAAGFARIGRSADDGDRARRNERLNVTHGSFLVLRKAPIAEC